MAVVKLANAINITVADAIADAVDVGGAGTLEIRTGALPADPNAAPSGTLLATLTFSVTAFGAAAQDGNNATATANAITADASADATGTAAHFRVLSGGGTVIWTGDVTATAGGGALELDSVSITTGQQVSVSAFTVSHHRDGTAT